MRLAIGRFFVGRICTDHIGISGFGTFEVDGPIAVTRRALGGNHLAVVALVGRFALDHVDTVGRSEEGVVHVGERSLHLCHHFVHLGDVGLARGLDTCEFLAHGIGSCLQRGFGTGLVVTETSGVVARGLLGGGGNFLCLRDQICHTSGIGIVGHELVIDFLQSIGGRVGGLFCLHFGTSRLDGIDERGHVGFGNRSNGRSHLVKGTFVDAEFRTEEVLVAAIHGVVAPVGQHFHAVVLVRLGRLEVDGTYGIVDLRVGIELECIRIGEGAYGKRIPTVFLPSVIVHNFRAVILRRSGFGHIELRCIVRTPEGHANGRTIAEGRLAVETLHPLEEEFVLCIVERELEVVVLQPSIVTAVPRAVEVGRSIVVEQDSKFVIGSRTFLRVSHGASKLVGRLHESVHSFHRAGGNVF